MRNLTLPTSDVADCPTTALDGIAKGDKVEGRNVPPDKQTQRRRCFGSEGAQAATEFGDRKTKRWGRSKKSSDQTPLHMKQGSWSLVLPRELLSAPVAMSLEL